jgi:prophage antirepressor-like protein
MAENKVSQIAPEINENSPKFLEIEGEILFSSEEVGLQLGYKQPAKSINILFNRNQKELQGYARHINLMYRDGKPREVRHFTEEGVYILSMLANMPHARDFRARVASLLRRLRQEAVQRQVENARTSALEEGKALALAEGGRELMAQGARAAFALSPARRAMLEKVLKYHKMGLTSAEIGVLTGRRHSVVSDYLSLGRRLCLLEAAPKTEAQRAAIRANLQKGPAAIRAASAAKGADHDQ